MSDEKEYKKDIRADASKLVSTMIDEDGSVFGVKMDPQLAEKARMVLSTMLIVAADKGQDLVAAKTGSQWWGKAAGYTIALSEQIVQMAQNTTELVKSLNSLNSTIKPLTKAAGSNQKIASLTVKNEVLANARTKMFSIFGQRSLDTLIGVISSIGAVATVWSKSNTAVAHHESLKEFEATGGDPTKLKEHLENQIYNGGAAKNAKGISGIQLRQAEEMVIATEIAAYKKGFETFKSENIKQKSTDLRAELEKLNPQEYDIQRLVLKNLGMHPDALADLDGKIKAIKALTIRQRQHRDIINPEANILAVINEFKSVNDKEKILTFHAEQSLRKEWVAQKGAINEWKSYADGNVPTVEDELRKKLNAITEERTKAQKIIEDAQKTDIFGGKLKDLGNLGIGFFSGVLRNVALSLFGGKALEQYTKPLASDRIGHLMNVMNSKGDSNWSMPNEVPPIPSKTKGRRDDDSQGSMSYSRYIHEIFQQHQRDSSWPEVGSRFSKKFESARWKDDEIQKMPDEDLSAYEFAIKTITKRIKDKRMAVAALVYLVGDPNGNKIVHSDGMTFGPKGAGKDDAAVKAGILNIIDSYSAMVQADHDISADEFNHKRSNFIFRDEELKQALDANDLDADKRAFIFRGFSDVLESEDKICKQLGVKNERCQQLRAESQETYNTKLDAIVEVLSDMSAHNANILEEQLNISERELKMIKTLVKREREEGRHVDDFVKDREEIELLKTLATNAAMILGSQVINGDDDSTQTFWQLVDGKVEELKKPLAERQEKAAHAEQASHKGRRQRDVRHDDDMRHEDNEAYPKARKPVSYDMGAEEDMFGDHGTRQSNRNMRHASRSDSSAGPDFERGVEKVSPSRWAADERDHSTGRIAPKAHNRVEAYEMGKLNGEDGHRGRETRRKATAKDVPFSMGDL